LLDEPGLSLHGKAQEDLLKYFEAEIKGEHQLIYTTHSPFMVDPANFDRVRIVQDLSVEHDDPPPEEAGTRVLTDVLQASNDSLFPLQGALGYEISQSLFVGPNCLVVEGVSDLLFLQGMGSLLDALGRTSLSNQWTITPVGGSGNVPTFVALLGAQTNLKIAVLIDYHKSLMTHFDDQNSPHHLPEQFSVSDPSFRLSLLHQCVDLLRELTHPSPLDSPSPSTESLPEEPESSPGTSDPTNVLSPSTLSPYGDETSLDQARMEALEIFDSRRLDVHPYVVLWMHILSRTMEKPMQH